MNALFYPEVLRVHHEAAQEALPLATEGVLRYVWEGRFGSMLIEVAGGVAYVNGARVESLDAGRTGETPANTAPRGVSS